MIEYIDYHLRSEIMNITLRTQKGAVVRRDLNLVPGVVYGKEIEPTTIQADPLDLAKAVKQYGKNRTFKIKVDGKEHQVYIKDYTLNPIKQNEFYSFDLQKVTAKDKITADIPVQLLGRDKFGKSSPLLLQVITNAVSCEYPVGKGVNSLDLDVSALEEGDALYVRDLDVPEGYKVHTPEDTMICNVSIPTYKEEDEESETEEVVDPADVEAIKQDNDEEEEA